MEISVVIVAYNSAEFLPKCLESIEAHLKGSSYEICLVDNASTDGGVARIRARFPGIKIVENDSNVGFSSGVNIGLRNTTGRFVLWLNPDAELLNDGIVELLGQFKEDPSVGVIGPKVENSNGSSQASCRSFPSYRTALFSRRSILTRLFPKNRFSVEYLQTDFDRSRRREVDWVSGACLLHRREVSDRLGGLDERFFMFCEDVDFCLRARKAGWKAVYHPALAVRHQMAGSTRQHPIRMIREHHRSMWRYYAKHFARNVLKDAVVGAAVWSRCGLMIFLEMTGLGGREP